MNKTLFTVLAGIVSVMPVAAENLFTGSQSVTWENTLYLPAEKFANSQIGDQLVVSLADGANDVMELKSDGQWLPGSTFNWIEGKNEVKAVLTQAMTTSLKEHGLELCGPAFTVISVDLNPDFMQVPDGAVWAGYFWIDGGWNTLELFKTAFDNQTPQKLIINFSDEAEGSNFVLNVLTKWDDDYMKLSSSETLTISGRQAVIDLTKLPDGRTFNSYFEGENTLKIQGHVDSGNSFNITSVVVDPYVPTSGIESVDFGVSENIDVYNLMGVKIKSATNRVEAVDNLPRGLYIIGTDKVLVK